MFCNGETCCCWRCSCHACINQGQSLDMTTLLISCCFVSWLINHRDIIVASWYWFVFPSSSPIQKPRKKLADTSVASNSESGLSSDSSSDGSLSSDLEDLAEDDEDDDDDDEEDEDEDKHSELSDSEKRMKKRSKVRRRRRRNQTRSSLTERIKVWRSSV